MSIEAKAFSGQLVFKEAPDWTREYCPPFSWQPSRALLKAVRSYQLASGPFAKISRALAVLRHRFWSVVTGADIPLNSRIAGGFQIPHPQGIVIHPDASIGPNCLFFQQVTIGDNGGVPTIGTRVDIGAGAKVLGSIMVGDYAKIGANAVVLCDVPAGATAVGNPARIILPAQKPRAGPGRQRSEGASLAAALCSAASPHDDNAQVILLEVNDAAPAE